jgi:hypothetical protein
MDREDILSLMFFDFIPSFDAVHFGMAGTEVDVPGVPRVDHQRLSRSDVLAAGCNIESGRIPLVTTHAS